MSDENLFPILYRANRYKEVVGKQRWSVTLLRNSKNQGLVIARYFFPKKNSWILSEVIQFHNEAEGDHTFDRLCAPRARRSDVKADPRPAYEIHGVKALKEHLISIWNNLGKENLQFLSPSIDVKGVKEPNQREIAPRLVEEAPIPVEDRIKQNPLWGIF